MSTLHTEGLTKSYGGRRVVDDLSLRVPEGTVYGLLGRNGAGKSTTLKILTSYLPATSGTAKVAGFDVRTQAMEVRQSMGYLPQSVPIYPEGVGYLAATLVVTDGTPVRVGRPPADPLPLLSEVRNALSAIPGARQASRAWLSISSQGEGLVISVTLDDPASQDAHQEVLDAVQRAVAAVPTQGFPIDVTFPGENEPDQVDAWISAYAEPFYIRASTPSTS